MPQPRKPVELLELSGRYRADRHARRRAAPKSPHPIGNPPSHLAPDEAAAWREHVRDPPAGVLTGYDRWTLEATARLVARSRREGLTGAELGNLRRFLGELGASPASRGRGQSVGRGAGQGLGHRHSGHAGACPTSCPWTVQDSPEWMMRQSPTC